MSSCYKCGRELPDGNVECEYGCNQGSRAIEQSFNQEQASLAQKQAMAAELLKNSRPIDWSKVKTVADVVLIMSVINSGTRFMNGSAPAIALERFLKDT